MAEPTPPPTAESQSTPPSIPQTPDKAEVEKPSIEVIEEGPVEKSRKKLYIVGGLILTIALLVSGYFFLQARSQPKEEKTPASSIEQSPSPSPTQVPKPTIDRSQWPFEVLNGSGVTGVAAKAAEKLEALGYTVVKIGNANRDDYEGDVLLVTKSMRDETNLLLEDLKKEFAIATVSGELKNSTASARLIIGKK